MFKRTFIRKYGGDDRHSWAVFIKGNPRPVVTGLSRKEAWYHQRIIETEVLK